jgi:2-amino-4-hydroxy-6-hydroxymethyldihydropteridine diphosphokinase
MFNSYILLGSNLGDKIANLNRTVQLLTTEGVFIKAQSPIYQTKAWGNVNQDDFYNVVLLVNTELKALKLIELLLGIEIKVGRVRGLEKWQPRIIDIDILYFENEIINNAQLVIPHPFIPQRKFTLIPLNDIAPEFKHPILNISNKQLLENCNDNSEVILTPYKLTMVNNEVL